MDLVYVEWLDHAGDATWLYADAEPDLSPVRCKTVGWVLAEDDTMLIVACSMGISKRPCSSLRQHIVKAAITQRRALHDPHPAS